MIAQLARMLGLSPTDAEASMHSERAARAVLTRRNLFAAGAAMATGLVVAEVGGFVAPQWPTLTFCYPPLASPGIIDLECFGQRVRFAYTATDSAKTIAEGLRAALLAKDVPLNVQIEVRR